MSRNGPFLSAPMPPRRPLPAPWLSLCPLLASGAYCSRIAAGIQKRATALAKAKLDGTTPQAEAPAPPPAAPANGSDMLTLDLDPDVCARPLPEAPASVNCYITLAGRMVQVTLRDSDEQRLLARLEALLQRFPAEDEGEQESPEGWCSTHGVQMTQHHNVKGSWWSHKTAEGWCHGK